MTKRWLPDGVERGTWAGMSEDHLWSARHLVELARAEEKAGEIGAQHESYRRHRSYVVGALLGSVCFVESAINELFSDCAELGFNHVAPAIAPDHRDVLGAMWSQGIGRLRMIEKYELALAVGLRPKFPKDDRRYRDVNAVVAVRNALVHYKPEWVYGVSEGLLPEAARHRFEKSLGGKFEENPLAEKSYEFWPDRCLSASCSQWAVDAVAGFVGRFAELMNPEFDGRS